MKSRIYLSAICATSLFFTTNCKSTAKNDDSSSSKETVSNFEGMSYKITGKFSPGTSGLVIGSKVEYTSTNCEETTYPDGAPVKSPKTLIVISESSLMSGSFEANIPLTTTKSSLLFFKKCNFVITRAESNPILFVTTPTIIEKLKRDPRGAFSRSKILIDAVDTEDLPQSQSLICHHSSNGTDCADSRVLVSKESLDANGVNITIK